MKTRFLILCLSLLVFTEAGYCQPARNYNLARNKLYNQLAENLKRSRNPSDVFYAGIVASAFNRPAESESILAGIDVQQLPDSLQLLYYKASYDNYMNLFNYKKAAETGNILLNNFKKFYTEEDHASLTEDINVWSILSNTEPQSATKYADATIPFIYDQFGLQNVLVKIGDSSCNFVFDTGASFCVASESFAKATGIKTVSEKEIKTKAIAGNFVKGRIGTIDSISIDHITAYHVVFYIFPDSILAFAGGRVKINAILGFPVIKSFGTFTQTKSAITVPFNDPVVENTNHNFIVQEKVPVIYLNVLGEELPFGFDTGDNDILLSKTFYDKFRSRLEGKMQKAGMEGAGKKIYYNSFVIDSITLIAGDKPATFKKLGVNTDSYHVSGKEYYGNVGQGLISKFKSMTISFTNAMISFND